MEANRSIPEFKQDATAQKDLFDYNTGLMINNAKEYRFFKTVLVDGVITRQALDDIAGVANSPDIVHKLRSTGWHIQTGRMSTIDRDGHQANPGYYKLAQEHVQSALKAVQAYENIKGVNHAGN